VRPAASVVSDDTSGLRRRTSPVSGSTTETAPPPQATVPSGSAVGPTVYEGTLLQGKTLPVSLKKGPVWIRIGDPPSIDVRLGGELVHGLPTQAGNVLLTRRGLKPTA